MEIFKEDYKVNKEIEYIELIVTDDMLIFNEDDISVFGLGAVVIVIKDEKKIAEKELTLATFFNTKPREVEHRGNDYVLKYYGGDKFINCKDGEIAETVISVSNQEFFFKKMVSGKMRPASNLSIGFKTILNNIDLNVPLDVPFLIKEIYASNVFRDTTKPEYPARVTGSDNYTILSTRNLVAYGPTYTALSFEDPTAMVVNKALVKGEKERVTMREKYATL